MVRERSESVEPAYAADIIDEYRELTMLAHAWEHGSIVPGVAEDAPARVAEGVGESAAVGEGHGNHL